MFDLRKKVYQLMVTDPVLQELSAPNELAVFQRSGNEQSEPPKTRPFVIYNLGITTPSGPSALRAHNRYVQVWVHDDPGDYHRIDQMLARIKEVFEAAPQEAEFYELRLVNDSPDLNDTGLDTIVKFAVFQAALSPGGI